MRDNFQSCKIKKIVINSVFYPGSRSEKLMSTSLGGILSSKFGDITLVESLIANGKLMLIPTCDIRGIEISDQDCIYLTEGQNTDAYTMRTIIQRAKEKCKIIIEGDMLEQVDIKIGNLKENGMFRTIEVFKDTKYFFMCEVKECIPIPCCWNCTEYNNNKFKIKGVRN